MKLNKLLSLAFLFIGLFTYAQRSTISGTVVDAETLKPIKDAEVILEGFEKATSNSLGNYQIWNIPFGNYTLKVKKENYPLFTQNLTLNSDYKFVRVRLGGTSIKGTETSSNDENVKIIKETVVVRDTVYIEKIVPVATVNDNNNAKEIKEAPQTTQNTSVSVVDTIATNKPVVPMLTLEDLNNDEVDDNNEDNISGVLTASRDPFYNTAAFTFGAYRFRLRGLDNNKNKIYMNNIEMNDLGLGRPSWTQWGGLNDVLRTREDVHGLEKCNFGYGGINGATNLDLRASNQRKQLKVSYAFSNRSYMNRLMGTYSTGLLKGGWAFSVSGSWRFANNDDISEKIRFNQHGTTYDAFSFFAGVDKKFGEKHLLSLNVFGAKNKRGKNAPATQEAMDLAGSNFYNPNWGWQTEPNGKRYRRNAKVGHVFIPTAILMHDWKITNSSNLKTSVAYRRGINGSSTLDWRNANDPRPDYYRNMPSFAGLASDSLSQNQVNSLLSNNPDLLQINWDLMYQVNRNNKEVINNVNGTSDTSEINIAQYIVAERRYDPSMANFAMVYDNRFNKNVKFTIGGNYANQQTHNYMKVKDLLGAESYIDINKYAARDFPGDDSLAQNDLNNPNRILKVGDKFGYEYTNHIHKGQIWTQTELNFKSLDIFVANNVNLTYFWRNGQVKNGYFPENSEGKSEVKKFINFGIRGGATYKVNGRNYLFANASYGTRAPYMRNAMTSPRTRNDFVPNLKNEELFAIEGGYLLKAPKLKVRAVAYYHINNNKTSNRGVYLDQKRTFGTYILDNVNTRNWGFEAAAEWEAFAGFKITPVIAWGDHTYTSRPKATLIEDNSNEPVINNESVYIKGLHLAVGPQAAYSLGLNYRTSNYWFFGVNFNYFDKIYIEPSPARRTLESLDNVEKDSELWASMLSQEKVKGQFVMNASIGKSLRLKDKKDKYHYLNFNLNANNITHNTKFRTGGFEQYRFNKSDGNLDRFQNKYFYSYGLNFFAQISYRF